MEVADQEEEELIAAGDADVTAMVVVDSGRPKSATNAPKSQSAAKPGLYPDVEGEPDVFVYVSLWRADMLTGVVEISDAGVIVKADPATGLVFGRLHSVLLNHYLHQ